MIALDEELDDEEDEDCGHCGEVGKYIQVSSKLEFTELLVTIDDELDDDELDDEEVELTPQFPSKVHSCHWPE